MNKSITYILLTFYFLFSIYCFGKISNSLNNRTLDYTPFIQNNSNNTPTPFEQWVPLYTNNKHNYWAANNEVGSISTPAPTAFLATTSAEDVGKNAKTDPLFPLQTDPLISEQTDPQFSAAN